MEKVRIGMTTQEDCNAYGALWSDESQLGPGGCDHTTGALNSDSTLASGPFLATALLAAVGPAL